MALQERLRAAEAEHGAAAARRYALEVAVPSAPALELQEARLGESHAWAQKEAARRDLVARLFPRQGPARRWTSSAARRLRAFGRREGVRGWQSPAPTLDQLWERVVSAEGKHESDVLYRDSLAEQSCSWGERLAHPFLSWKEHRVCKEARRWAEESAARAERARHELDAFLNPARYGREGYRSEGLDGIRTQAAADVVRERAMLDALIEELIYSHREHVELIHLAGDGLTPTPYEAGLAAQGAAWADLGLPEPTPVDPADGGIPGMSWRFPEMPDREAET